MEESFPYFRTGAGNTYLEIRDNYGKVRNQQILIIAESGFGKGLTTGGLIEEFHKAGYLVLCLADPKDEWEFAYQMFKPEEKYHLDHLRKIGKMPSSKKVKLYHPFTFNIPKKDYLPEINFYTLSLKDMGREEWSLIAETGYDTEVMKLLLKASNEITNEDGLFGFLHLVQNSIKGKISGKKRKYDPKNFYLEATSGTAKSIMEISNQLRLFQKDYFLIKENSPLKLNWKNIFEDRESIHVFQSNWIKDEKLKDFIVLSLFQGVLDNKKYLKYPVLIVFPEINKLCPYKPEGHKRFLSRSIKGLLGIIRSSGRGMSSISDSQVYVDIDEEVRNKSTVTLLGQLGGGVDLDRVSKMYNYKREIRDQLRSMDYQNSFLIKGKEDEGAVIFWFSSSCHAEPNYNFIEFYKKHKKLVKKYNDLFKTMRKLYDDEEKKIIQKVKNKEKTEKKSEEQLKKEKEINVKKIEKVDEKIEKAKEQVKQSKEQIMKLCYEMYHNKELDSSERTLRKIGEKYGIGHKTVKRYINKWKEKLEENARPRGLEENDEEMSEL